jgi:BirA family transcriptional regulator, biotin operon repressor / biotin---[acetyl-CoA-carboxylase] ligase
MAMDNVDSGSGMKSGPLPIRWPAESIWQAVEPLLPGFTVEVLPEIDSTNTELMRRFKAGRPEPTLLVAEHQSAGRGRLGRIWQSQRVSSLTFSLGLPLAPADWSGLSLAVGISLAESLDPARAADFHIGLKWPNDLWLCTPGTERKLAGILVETASGDGMRHVVIGVGINISTGMMGHWPGSAPTFLPAAIPPAGLEELLPGMDAARALGLVVPALVRAVQAFERFGFAPFQPRFERRDLLANRSVQVLDGQQTLDGSAHGVGDNGALRVLTAGGMKEITSSEVSVRPLAGNAASDAGLPC